MMLPNFPACRYWFVMDNYPDGSNSGAAGFAEWLDDGPKGNWLIMAANGENIVMRKETKKQVRFYEQVLIAFELEEDATLFRLTWDKE